MRLKEGGVAANVGVHGRDMKLSSGFHATAHLCTGSDQRTPFLLIEEQIKGRAPLAAALQMREVFRE